MKYCNRCLYPVNHPLHLTFDTQDVCSGCRVHEEKDVLNWQQRGQKLGQLLQSFKSKTGRTYDCIVPVSGARDSYFIVHTVKNIYGMNPLLVTYNKHYNTRVGIRNLAYLRTLFGCDLLTLTVSPAVVKKITRITLHQLGSIYWHCLAGSTVFPVQMAVRLKIPLIVWDVHQGCDQVGMFSHLNEVEMTRKYRKEHDLMGCEAEDLIDNHQEKITLDELTPYIYPHDQEIAAIGVRGIYLSNYIRWDSKAQHEHMIDLYGYESAPQRRTFDTYSDVDCFHYSDLHDYIKEIKWGYGKVTDHACREIRLRRLTREQGIALVKRYRRIRPDRHRLNLFLDWIDMDETQFWQLIESKRNLSLWQQNSRGHWQLIDPIEHHLADPHIASVRLTPQEDCHFRLTDSKEPQHKQGKYILIGRGYVDEPKV